MLKRLSENSVLADFVRKSRIVAMARYIEGTDRYQPMLLPTAVDDYISPASPVRAIDAFVDSLDLPALGFKTRDDFSEGRSSYHPVIVRSRERLAADPAAMRTRASLVEHPFSTIKDRHGYTGLLCRGIKLATAEMGMSAWAYNFTRVINLVGLDELLEAIRLKNAPPLA